MRFSVILRYMGMILLLDAGMMLISALVSLAYGMDTGFYPLLLSTVLTGALGAFPLIFVGRSEQINSKEGYFIVVGSWIVSCIVGTFPYLLWGGEFSVVNAWFESVSGYTTTGATILNDIEALPHGLLFWRACTPFLGGIGVVMFALVVLPSLGRTKMTLSSVEISPLAKDNYRYRTQKMIQVLLVVYLGMIAAQSVLLKVAGVGWFDAITTAFSTIATCGFSIRNASIAAYGSLWVEIIMTVFMVLASVHFGIIFATLTGKLNNIFRSEVAKYYIACIVGASVVIAGSLWIQGSYSSFFTALRYSTFQVAAMSSTSGFVTADTNTWTSLSMIILIVIGLQCGIAGSTAGGIKADRILLSLKVMRSKILQQQHPSAIIRVKLNNIIQDADVINFAMIFIVAYISLILIGTIVVTAFGVDFVTAGSSVISSMGNIGPGFGSVGSLGNYDGLPWPVKIIHTVLMLLGRLEIFGFIQLFLIKWWK
ncbi:MAG: TrkH family potassium uptake protein [Rikenellaceae bacterium]|jgi:trk system potassium uptake protein TrkH|nr:TrkH family potassium uptake protein [Rikenellaceae bacterium]